MKTSITNRVVIVALVLQALAWVSCTDDTFQSTYRSDNTIRYSAFIAQKDSRSRSNSTSPYTSFSAQKMDNSEIYLLTTTEDHINTHPFGGSEAEAEALAKMEAAANATVSRAPLITQDNIDDEALGKDIELFAYAYDNQYANYSEAFSAGEVKDYIINNHLTIGKDTDGNFTLSPALTRYWPGDEYNMSFFAIFPSKEDYEEATGGEYNVVFENQADPYVEPFVATDVFNQQDVLVGRTHCSGSPSNGVVNLQMKHIKAAVSVNLGTGFAGRRIHSVRFENVHTKSRYLVNTGTWDRQFLNEDNTTVEAVFNPTREVVTSMKDDNNYFMMIPQHLDAASRYKLHESVRLTVVVYDPTEKTDETYTTELSGNWEEGYTYNYTISTAPRQEDYIFTLDTHDLYFSYDGTPAGDNDSGEYNGITISDVSKLNVKSWKLVTTGDGTGAVTTCTPVNWTASFYPGGGAMFDNSARSEGYASIPFNTADDESYYKISGITNDENQFNYRFKVKLTDNSDVNEYDENDLAYMKSKTLGTTSNRVDLSLNNAATGDPYPGSSTNHNRYTANCYIVNHPGHYKIPVVYGNSIYDDETYARAYILGGYFNSEIANSSFALKRLLRYDGEVIANYDADNPWISWAASTGYFNKHYPGADGGTSFHDTFVLWEDCEGLVTIGNNGFTEKIGEEYYICFDVKDDIKPGNAVIEVINTNSEVLWSYHIWVTPTKPSDTFTCDANKVGTVGKSTFLEVPLGYVQGPKRHYPERVDSILLTQAVSGHTQTVTVRQKPHDFVIQSCTYYQWGRKDAFPGFETRETKHLKIDQTYEVNTKPRQCWGENRSHGNFQKLNDPESSNYNSSIAFTLKSPTKNDKIPEGILYPTTFFTGKWWPLNVYYWDLWGCQMNTVCDTADGVYPTSDFGSISYKTAYDPCPYGFKVPPVYAMPAITYDGKNHSAEFSPITKQLDSEEDLYAKYVNTANKDHTDFMNTMAFEFYTDKMPGIGVKGGGDVFKIYAMGKIEVNGIYEGMGSHGFYWCSTRWTAATGIYNSRGYYFQFGYGDGKSNFEAVFGNTINTYGLPILPYKAEK